MTPAPIDFSAGATTLPPAVIDRVGRDVTGWRATGRSVLEIPFSSTAFHTIQDEAEQRLRRLMRIPDHYAVLFAQGGAFGHFALVAMNLLDGGGEAAYVESGLWAQRAMAEAAKVCRVVVAASGAETGFIRLPSPACWQVPAGAGYLHLTTNESAEGLQYRDVPPQCGVPLVADMTGDFLAREVDVDCFGLIYASTTKSLGAAGLTIVIVRRDLLTSRDHRIPAPFDYARLAEANSRVNTPPSFAIYVAGEMLRWMEEEGGVATLAERRRRRAERLYGILDASPAFHCPAEPGSRSITTLCFRTTAAGGEAAFLAAAEQAGIGGLAGHPARGGLRATLHAGHDADAIDRLAALLESHTG